MIQYGYMVREMKRPNLGNITMDCSLIQNCNLLQPPATSSDSSKKHGRKTFYVVRLKGDNSIESYPQNGNDNWFNCLHWNLWLATSSTGLPCFQTNPERRMFWRTRASAALVYQEQRTSDLRDSVSQLFIDGNKTADADWPWFSFYTTGFHLEVAYIMFHMVVSWNGGTPKPSILDWDFPWNRPSSYWGFPMVFPWFSYGLGYPRDYGNLHVCYLAITRSIGSLLSLFIALSPDAPPVDHSISVRSH